MIKPSEYKLETIHQDGEFILYRGTALGKGGDESPSILALSPVMKHSSATFHFTLPTTPEA